ncbi:MAG: hypothetical protein Hyperionvirus11_63 [Hyperionvirus sp.]|uniref:Uncharacterized protein n=1 Tax=Hyperionvirus sp. TaxID=2487770 RepID=A0A3G5A936_9VIRU|nr:MAG: hypothetical protein Hyperionvirus11_63 [Hyperionvirus sp.]
MVEYTIAEAFAAGLEVEPICNLGHFTEDDQNLSFHRIHSHFEYISQSLKWQWANIISDDFLCNELCNFVEGDTGVFFFRDSNNYEIAKTRFVYALRSSIYSPQILKMGILSFHGPQHMEKSVIEKQLKSYGFVLWEAYDEGDLLENKKAKYGSLRHFYPELEVYLAECDKYLCCEYNTKKGIKYLKLLRGSYIERLTGVFDALPNVLLILYLVMFWVNW